MVCRFGMSEHLGAQTFGAPGGARFLDLGGSLGDDRNYSEETAQAIDHEVRALLETERLRAAEILDRRRPLLETLAERLIVEETLDRAELEAITRVHTQAA